MRPTLSMIVIGKCRMWIHRQSPFHDINIATCLNHNLYGTAPRRHITLAAWYTKKKRNYAKKRGEDHASKSLPDNCSNAVSNATNTKHLLNNDHRHNKTISPRRFFNPWEELAAIIPSEEMLQEKVESTTRTFGIVAALMGSVAAALLTFNSYDGYDANREPVRNRESNGGSSSNKNNNNQRSDYDNKHSGDEKRQPFSSLPLKRRNTIGFIEHVTFTHHISGTSLLVSWGIPKSKLDDIYTACCAGSFYSGVLTTVLASVINAWMAATPPGFVRSFVRVHSWYIVALPALLGISTGLAGSALFIGLDRECGTPVSYVGLGGTLFGGAAIALVAGRGWIHNYKSLTDAVVKRVGKGGMH